MTNRFLPLISFTDAVAYNKILATNLNPPEGPQASLPATAGTTPHIPRGAVVVRLQANKYIREEELDNPSAQGGSLQTTVSKVLEKPLALCNTNVGRIDVMANAEEYARKVRELLAINREIASLSKEDRKGIEGTRQRARREEIASRLRAIPIKVDVGTRQQAENVAKECARDKPRHLGEVVDVPLYVKDSGSYCRNCLENNCKGCGDKDKQKCRRCGATGHIEAEGCTKITLCNNCKTLGRPHDHRMKSSQCPKFSEHKRQTKNQIQNHNRLAFAQLHQGQGQAQGSQFYSSVRSYRDAAMRITTTTTTGPMAGKTQGPQESSGNPVGPGPFALRPPDIDNEFAGDDFPSLPERGSNQITEASNGKAGETWSEQVERTIINNKEAIPLINPLPKSRMEETLLALSEKVDELGKSLVTLDKKLSSLTEEVQNAEEG